MLNTISGKSKSNFLSVPIDKDKERTRSIQLENQKLLNFYKKQLSITILICFVICIIVVAERVFRAPLEKGEAIFILKVQNYFRSSFGLEEDSDAKRFYYFIGFFGDFKCYIFFITHLFVSFYVSIDAVIALKGLFIHSMSLFFFTIMSLIYQGSRPFWSNEDIHTFYCDNSFNNPSILVFSLFFDGSYLLSLLIKKYKEIRLLEQVNSGEQAERENNKIALIVKILIAFGIIIAHLFLFLRYLIGLYYILDYIMALLYSAISFMFVRKLDTNIESIIKNSTVIKKEARKYLFFWISFCIIGVIVAYLIYLSSSPTPNTKWIKNYLSCLQKNQNIYYKEPYYGLIGHYPTFLQSTVLLGWMGGILGAQLCFSHIPNINWYKGDLKKRFLRFALANLFMIPSWVFINFENKLINVASVRDLGLDNFSVDIIHYFCLYFFLFAVVPIIFHSLKLTHIDVKYMMLIKS